MRASGASIFSAPMGLEKLRFFFRIAPRDVRRRLVRSSPGVAGGASERRLGGSRKVLQIRKDCAKRYYA
jgi:hypothetical protein